MVIECLNCGFCCSEDDHHICFHDQQRIEKLTKESCTQYIEIQYDGTVPYTPEEHLFFLETLIQSKKMKNMQGMRF